MRHSVRSRGGGDIQMIKSKADYYAGMRDYKRICLECLMETNCTPHTKVMFQEEIFEKARVIFDIRLKQKMSNGKVVFLK